MPPLDQPYMMGPPQPGTGGVEMEDQKGEDLTITLDEQGGLHVETPDKGSEKESRFDQDLTDKIDDGTLAMLAGMLIERIEGDDNNRAPWLDTANTSAKYLGINIREPTMASAAEEGAVCTSVPSALMEAVTKSWSNARAELLPVGGPVRVKRTDAPAQDIPEQADPGVKQNEGDPSSPASLPGAPSSGLSPQGGPTTPGGIAGQSPPTGPPLPKNRDHLADALEQDMNWFLTTGDREYYPDFSRMLFHRALIGNAFRKVYWCPLRRAPRSVWVRAEDLIVSNDCSHLSKAGRVTEIVKMRQAVMKRMQALGHYRDIELVRPSGEATTTDLAEEEVTGVRSTPERPEDAEHLLYECRCELSSDFISGLAQLDRDETGKDCKYPLPYRVTIDRDSRLILEIRRDWEEGDPDHVRKVSYVKYGYIPGIGFYDYGLIHMAGNTVLAAMMLERSSVDAALFNNFPGGFYKQSPGTREEQTIWRPGPGQWIGIKTMDPKLTDTFFPNPYKPPSAEAIGMAQSFEQRVRRIAGVVEMPVGEGRIGNTPVGTMMSYVEAVTQVPSAIHKDDFIAQAEEFELLRKLFAKNPEALTRGNRNPARIWQAAEEIMAQDISPAADPNTPSIVHRLMKLQAKVMMGGLPQFAQVADNRAIWREGMQLLGTGPDDCTQPPPQPGAAPPDPKAMGVMMKAQTDQAKIKATMQKDQDDNAVKREALQNESQERAADRDSEETRAAMSLEGQRIAATHKTANAGADRAHEATQNAQDRAHEVALEGAKQQAAQQEPEQPDQGPGF